MSIDIGVNEAGRDALVEALRKLLAETYALYSKTHSYHWNVNGPRFTTLHTLFETHYNELWTALDEIAERIRSLGAYAPLSSAEMLEPATIKPDNSIPDADAMVANLVKGHETVARIAREGVGVAEEAGDPVTADLMTVRASIADKTAWMLRSSL